MEKINESLNALHGNTCNEMPTLEFVMSMTEYAWSIWIKNQPPAVIQHLKELVRSAPPNAVRAKQIKSM